MSEINNKKRGQHLLDCMEGFDFPNVRKRIYPPEWISLENNKDPLIYNKPVLVTDGKVIDIASLRFIDGHLKAWDKNKLKNGVTHWMPLPSIDGLK